MHNGAVEYLLVQAKSGNGDVKCLKVWVTFLGTIEVWGTKWRSIGKSRNHERKV